MAFPTVVSSSSSNIYTNQEAWLTILGGKNFQKVQILPEKTFDIFLWKTLTLSGINDYHLHIAKELLPGWLWVQEDYIFPFTILWSTYTQIHRAYLLENKITVEFYNISNAQINKAEQEMSIREFQKMTASYLANFSKSSHNNKHFIQSHIARDFQKQLELLPITVTITQSAFLQLEQLKNQYGSIPISINLKMQNFSHNIKLITISNNVIKRLFHTYKTTKDFNKIAENVAPVIRSWEAFNSLSKQSKTISELSKDRSVEKISSKNLTNLTNLIAWLNLNTISYKFQKLENVRNEQTFLVLSIDHQGTWKLYSQFFFKPNMLMG